MACVIAAPASGTGKTLLSLLLTSWARKRKLKIQTFKIGPDYLDPQQLSAVSKRECRNLDMILCGSHWVKESFYGFGGSADLTLVEGVMGLFDGIGSSEKGSTAAIAGLLQLPVVLVVDARGQAASLAALVKGFQHQGPQLELAGVVLNHINTLRHKQLLEDVLNGIGVKMLGHMPSDPKLHIASKHLGLVPAHEIENLEKKAEDWAMIAETCLDLKSFKKILKSPRQTKNSINELIQPHHEDSIINLSNSSPIAIAEDKAFHFRYHETKEYLERIGMACMRWKPIEDEEIPKEAKGLIIPGGYPEQYSEQLSTCKRSINSLRVFSQNYPIYAECGGMLILGQTLTDLNGVIHPMAGLLPFHARQGPLKVGYRHMTCKKSSLVTQAGDKLSGHEFHRWELNINNSKPDAMYHPATSKGLKFNSIWNVKGSYIDEFQEGWGNKNLHASWIHLHWASSPNIIRNWLKAINSNQQNKL